MLQIADLFPLILTAALTALAATPLAARAARALGLLDVPGSAPHKQHDHSTPDAGGMALALAVAAGFVVVGLPLDQDVFAILAGAVLIGLWGMWDDRVDLPPLAKLLGQVLAAIVLIRAGVGVHIFTTNWLNVLLTLFWVTGMINAFNFVDSMDGLALGLAGVAAAFFMLVTLDSGQVALAQLAAIILGASAGLYYFNALPAKIFLGDSGAQMLGLLLAGLGVAYTPVGLPQEVSWFTPILVLGVPIFDAALVVLDRARAKLPLYRGRLDHSYHRLRRLGLSRNRAVLTMHLTAAGLGLLSFIALDLSPLGANLLNAAVLLSGFTALVMLLRVQPEQDEAGLDDETNGG